MTTTICDKNSEYERVHSSQYLQPSWRFPKFFCKFGTKIGLSAQSSIRSCGFKSHNFHISTLSTFFFYIVSSTTLNFTTCVSFVLCKNWFFFRANAFFGLDHILVLTGSINITRTGSPAWVVLLSVELIMVHGICCIPNKRCQCWWCWSLPINWINN